MVAGVRAAVRRILADGCLPVVIGGDCPLLLGCLAGARDRHGRLGLLFVDGHDDAYPPALSPTGQAADMELGVALGLSTSGIPELDTLLPLIAAEDVVGVGASWRKMTRPRRLHGAQGDAPDVSATGGVWRLLPHLLRHSQGCVGWVPLCRACSARSSLGQLRLHATLSIANPSPQIALRAGGGCPQK